MKTYVLVFYLCMASISMAKAQYDNIRFPLSADEKEMVKRYNLKSMKMYLLRENTKDSLTQMMSYDPNGKLLKSVSDGVHYVYGYNKAGNVIRMTDSLRDKETNALIRDTFLFFYDNEGYLSKVKINGYESVFYKDSTTLTLAERKKDPSWPELLTNTYTYNTRKDIVEMHLQNPSGGNTTTELIKYDAEGRMVSDKVTLSWKDNIDSTININYQYGPNGKKSSEETIISVHDPDKRIFKNTKKFEIKTAREYHYDLNDRLIEEFMFEEGKEKERYVFTYKGTWSEPVSETFFYNGRIERSDNFELDERGLPHILTETADGKTIQFRYEFEVR